MTDRNCNIDIDESAKLLGTDRGGRGAAIYALTLYSVTFFVLGFWMAVVTVAGVVGTGMWVANFMIWGCAAVSFREFLRRMRI